MISNPPIGGKNFRQRVLFFGGGYIESENCFKTLKWSTIEWKRYKWDFFLYFRYFFKDFFKMIFDNNFFFGDVQIH